MCLQCQVLMSLTGLLRNLVHMEYPRYRQQLEWYASPARPATMTRPSVFPYSPDDQVDVAVTLNTFIAFVGRLCSVGLQLEPGNILLSHCVLDFYELVSTKYEARPG